MSPSIRRRRVTAASPSPTKLATFLRHLEESGSVILAAKRTGIGRNTLYLRRKADPAFALGWEKGGRGPRIRQPPADVPAAHVPAT